MIDVDRSAGQWFVNKQTDIFNGTSTELALLGITQKRGLLDQVRDEQEYEETLELIMDVMAVRPAGHYNKNFNIIREQAEANILTDEDMISGKHEFEGFAVGTMSEIGQRVRLQGMEKGLFCARCGAKINICHALRPTGLCLPCTTEVMYDVQKDNFEKLRW